MPVTPIDQQEDDPWLDDEALLPDLSELTELPDDLGFDYAEADEPPEESEEN